MTESPVAPAPLLLYDGSCGFCARSVQFVLAHEGPRRSLQFASLQGPTGQEVLTRHPELLRVDSLIWYEPSAPDGRRAERVLVRSSAVLAVAAYLGRGWRILGALGWLVPRVARDAVYRWVARHRHSLAAEFCVLPSAEQRRRFLDPGVAS
jgi:predicted DCC family thiol-disulfide oxidoreductase YuxK